MTIGQAAYLGSYLGVQSVDTVPDSHPEDLLWHWQVEGAARTGDTFEDSGIIQAATAEDALNWLADRRFHRSPFWGGLDMASEFTISMRPAEEADGDANG